MKLKIPVQHTLHGGLVELRTPLESDYPQIQALFNDRSTMEVLVPYFKTETWTLEMIKERYEGYAKLQKAGEAIAYTVVHKPTGQIAGNCGFKNINPQKGQIEFGIIISKNFWGTGVALECHMLCLEYAFEELHFQRVVFETDAHNYRLIGFFSKLGIPETGRTQGDVFFALQRTAWPAMRSIPVSK